MDKSKIKLDDLQVGMYIEIPDSWFSHNFLSSKFKIKSLSQLKQVKQLRCSEIIVDYSKSDVKPPESKVIKSLPQSKTKRVIDPKFDEPPSKWSSEELITDDLRNVLEDRKLPPQKKSAVVYQHSVSMMEQLLEYPTIENIRASKQAIYAISDMVLKEDETAMNMLRITSHDFYTYTHSVNVGLTSIMLSKALFKHSYAHNLQELAAGFFLHDLGKVKIDPKILNKPARLTDEEYRRIKTHPYQGFKLLKQADALSLECSTIVMQHHECDDGSGYPRHLEGDEIHIYGKICALADVFDALTAERSYKKAMTPFDAMSLMKQELISHFDSKLFAQFVKLFS